MHTKQMTIYIDQDKHHNLKIKACEERKTVSTVIRNIIDNYLREEKTVKISLTINKVDFDKLQIKALNQKKSITQVIGKLINIYVDVNDKVKSESKNSTSDPLDVF